MRKRAPAAAPAGANARRLIAFRRPLVSPNQGAAAVDEMDDSSPEVTISPADNGHVVRWHQRGAKKDEPGRTIKRVASTKEEALGHADEALGGGGSTKSSKKRSVSRDGQTSVSDTGDGLTSPVAHSSHSMRGRSARRRPVRSRRRA
jgi:hypothetical protein